MSSSLTGAQIPPPIGDPTGRAGEQPAIRAEEPRSPAPVPVLPPLPPPPSRELELTPRARVFVRDIRVVGSTVFSDEELAAVTGPYANRFITSEDLEALRLALTLLYVNKGYINSGAILPDQALADGVVTYRFVEGQVNEIRVEGNRWFRSDYLERRLALGVGPPLNVNQLQHRFQFLLEDQRIRRLNAELTPGLRPGDSALRVQIEERIPYRLTAEFNNYLPPSVGAERGVLTAEHQNLTGNGDALRLQYGRSRGLDPLLDLRYAVPVSARDTTLILQYRKNTYSIIEEPFNRLDVRSKSDVYGITVRHPVHRTRATEVALEATGERLSNRTSLLGEPFTLSAGARNGESVVSSLRFAQEIVHRTAEQVVAARSRFSLGVDALGATINERGIPSGKYFAWLGQFQWVQRLATLDTQIIARADTQLTGDALLGLEQFAVGGRYTVRGYRENTFVRDNALVLSLEARVAIIRGAAWADYVELAPFVDYGKAWNADNRAESAPHIASAGLGLRWAKTFQSAVPVRAHVEVYWGHPFRNVRTTGTNLQDRGVHLQLAVSAF